MAPSTPPPPSRLSLAALTMASSSSVVISATMMSMRCGMTRPPVLYGRCYGAPASGGVSTLRWYNVAMTLSTAARAFPAPEHDHDICLDEAMARARKAFEDKGLRLTPLRQSVFREIAAASHKAIGAYEVLERLAKRGERLAPISVYRAIDTLGAAGIVHRFESRNAFFACHAGHEERQLVLACEQCGALAEVDGSKVFAAIDG